MISDRATASVHSPSSGQRLDHSCHHRVGLIECTRDVAGRRLGAIGKVPDHVENPALALGHLEVGDGLIVDSPQLDVGVQANPIGAGDGRDAWFGTSHPGDDRAVIKANGQLHPHGHAAATALDDANDVVCFFQLGHEVDDGHLALVGLEDRFEHERSRPVLPVDLPHAAGGREQPSTVLRGAEQGGEASA